MDIHISWLYNYHHHHGYFIIDIIMDIWIIMDIHNYMDNYHGTLVTLPRTGMVISST